jgi:hypothetical protein
MGLPPISIMGLGRSADSSDIRVPLPPANMTTFIATNISEDGRYSVIQSQKTITTSKY